MLDGGIRIYNETSNHNGIDKLSVVVFTVTYPLLNDKQTVPES